MNNDFNRNTRTLIYCFALAIMVLVPLRFVEVGNTNNQSVLGESVEETSGCLDSKYVDQVESNIRSDPNLTSVAWEINNFEQRRCR